jgi:transposase
MTRTRPERLVSVDESGATIRLTPLMDRAPRVQRCVGQVPRNWGQSTTLLAAMTQQGVTAALVVAGATDRLVFETFVEQVLARRFRPGQIVVWDNLSVHKSPRARVAVVSRVCELRFLQTYSPDFNPIEQALSKLKARLRRAKARTQSQSLGRDRRRTARHHCGR